MSLKPHSDETNDLEYFFLDGSQWGACFLRQQYFKTNFFKTNFLGHFLRQSFFKTKFLRQNFLRQYSFKINVSNIDFLK